MIEERVGATLIKRNNKFLLIKANTGAAGGLWNNPGGRINADEDFKRGAIRETLEETGYQVEVMRLVSIFCFKDHNVSVIKKVFEAEIIGGELTLPKNEIAEACWFGSDESGDEKEFTFGAIQSIRDFTRKQFGRIHHTNIIA